ncbi:hypothetical protein CDD82_5268 [Ophiocordyceps australis]|uniref:Uncharacterized protein n=1 Tax=Ophiocordyceps australis TaxID=1399860 RepID=A0A2C5Z3P8_9HYPO|nr:hypothetical protein CDD82_5268 [Ophiocordyceps australis]
MPASTSPAPAPQATPSRLGENKAIRFQIKTGNSRWTCTLQDRASYEKTKSERTGSVDSAASDSSSGASSPTH